MNPVDRSAWNRVSAERRAPLAAPGRTSDSRRAGSAMRGLKSKAKGTLKRLTAAFDDLLYSFDVPQLSEGLQALGVSTGAVLLVHTSFDAFRAFQGRPTDVVAALQALVGPEGAILMPTMPFSGTAIEWARANPTVDLRCAPSRMGLVSEVFRRMPNVVRSIHPTHPVAAWGSCARELIAEHWRATTPCGAGSPYHRLLECNGLVVLLGADISSLTFFHTAEAMLADGWPRSPFTREMYRLTTLAADGTAYITQTRLFDPAVSRRRNLRKLLPELIARRAWKLLRVGRLSISAVRARDVLDAVDALARRGDYAYDDLIDERELA
jgi:aminoglycoside 3-N-acetyltransferase